MYVTAGYRTVFYVYVMLPLQCCSMPADL